MSELWDAVFGLSSDSTEPMTVEKMAELIDAVEAEWPHVHVHVIHPRSRVCFDCGMWVP